MIEQSFPKCKIKGDYKPVKFVHMGSEGSIPAKCRECEFNLEARCTRGLEKTGKYLELDYGPCGVVGASEPAESEFIIGDRLAIIPKKCTECDLASQWGSKVVCLDKKEIYGAYPRSLDWGEYVAPHEHIYA